jgi:hypothetical protein
VAGGIVSADVGSGSGALAWRAALALLTISTIFETAKITRKIRSFSTVLRPILCRSVNYSP